ncbi:MAG: hypothetical protein NTY19_17460, partial [Planctomycetota bacterium]|nr:hypothetical protein [Planctomycetota bacterium]
RDSPTCFVPGAPSSPSPPKFAAGSIRRPACSVGRLQQDGDRDVAGLCAELAASRGRTLIAARWPIADTETARFTQLLVDEYLAAAQAANGGVLPLFARAFRRALDRAEADPEITFHLAAAFDLYGLG